MKKMIRAAMAVFCTLWMAVDVLSVQAAEGQSTPAIEREYGAETESSDKEYGAESKGDSGKEYGAPPYGMKEAVSSRMMFAQQVTATTAFWQETVETLAPFTYGHNVKVDNFSDPDAMGLVYESEGSGVILTVDDNYVYIATAAHCLKRTNTVVELADGSSHRALVIYRNSNKDVGFLAIPCADLKPETWNVISPAAGADAEAIGKTAGDVVFVLSSVDKPNGEVYAGLLDRYSVEYPNNPQQDVLQFFSDVSYGSSGGAVYTAEGIWIGSVSGGDTYGVCWAVPYNDILNEFQACLTLLALQQAAAA